MKENIKRLAVLVIITIIATFIMADTVMADPPGHHAIQGQYAATGGGTCFAAPLGFDNLAPKNGAYNLMTFSMEGIFTFYRDGTGHAKRINPTVIHPSPVIAGSPFAGIYEDEWNFTYEFERDGSITLTTDIREDGGPDYDGQFTSGPWKDIVGGRQAGRNWRGTVSPDAKTVILNGGLNDLITNYPPNTTEIICNVSAVLNWQHDTHHKHDIDH